MKQNNRSNHCNKVKSHTSQHNKNLYLIFALLFYNNIEKSASHLKKKWKFAKTTIYLNLQNIALPRIFLKVSKLIFSKENYLRTSDSDWFCQHETCFYQKMLINLFKVNIPLCLNAPLYFAANAASTSATEYQGVLKRSS